MGDVLAKEQEGRQESTCPTWRCPNGYKAIHFYKGRGKMVCSLHFWVMSNRVPVTEAGGEMWRAD